jgi:hypothetical protein
MVLRLKSYAAVHQQSWLSRTKQWVPDNGYYSEGVLAPLPGAQQMLLVASTEPNGQVDSESLFGDHKPETTKPQLGVDERWQRGMLPRGRTTQTMYQVGCSGGIERGVRQGVWTLTGHYRRRE